MILFSGLIIFAFSQTPCGLALDPTPLPSALPLAIPTLIPTVTPTLLSTIEPTATSLSANEVSVNILGRSGKMIISTKGGKRSTVQMDFIHEFNSDGIIIGNNGPNEEQHSRNNFANTNFEFSSSYSTVVSGLAAQAIRFSTPLVGGVATLIVTTFIFLEKGAITPTDTETFNVQAGSVKFNIELKDWPFCNVSETPENICGGDFGSYVDFGINIEGASAPGANVSTDADLLLSNKVSMDGSWQMLPAGYPRAEAKDGAKRIFYTFRFPRFTSTALYDPIITFKNILSPSPPPVPTPTPEATVVTSSYTVALATSSNDFEDDLELSTFALGRIAGIAAIALVVAMLIFCAGVCIHFYKKDSDGIYDDDAIEQIIYRDILRNPTWSSNSSSSVVSSTSSSSRSSGELEVEGLAI